MPDFSVVYYSDSSLPELLKRYCLRNLARVAFASGGELVCVTWQPVRIGGARNLIWTDHEFHHRNIYGQILAGIAEAASPTVLLAEHDVLYPPGYHAAIARSARTGLCYNTNVWRLDRRGFFPAGRSRLLSNCGGPRDVLARRIRGKLDELRRDGKVLWAEPKGDLEIRCPLPTLDIRHGHNFTGDRDSRDGRYLAEVEYWGRASRYRRLW